MIICREWICLFNLIYSAAAKIPVHNAQNTAEIMNDFTKKL